MTTARGRTGLGVAAIVGVVCLALVAGFASRTRGRRPAADSMASAAINGQTPWTALSAALREGDARALAELYQRSTSPAAAAAAAGPAAAPTVDEAARWVDALAATRVGFLKFGSYGRSSALVVVGRVFRRFAAEGAPSGWAPALPLAHDLLTSGLADDQVDVKVSALAEVGKLWGWLPGRSLGATEEESLAAWKDGLTVPVVRRLGDTQPRVRAAAVACLGNLPIDGAAAPAIAYLEDPVSPEVRKQVLVSFARRNGLLTEDAVLRHVYDPGAGVPEAAELVLKLRGLTREQISLGSMIFHPRAEIRASVIPLLRERTDIDPVVWLMELSRDGEESVRLSAAEALSRRMSPEVGRRLAEMARTDQSPAVRKLASLPPLPNAPGLRPNAN